MSESTSFGAGVPERNLAFRDFGGLLRLTLRGSLALGLYLRLGLRLS